MASASAAKTATPGPGASAAPPAPGSPRLLSPALKSALLSSVKAFIFDCDGVIWKGDSVIPGVPETLDLLRSQGKRLFFVTNNSTKSRKGYLGKFTSLGLNIAPEEIFSSSYAAAAYLSSIKVGCRGVGGGEFGTIFQDLAIRSMSYIPGSSVIFQIERITQDMGLYAPYSIIRAGSTIYFYSNKGFYKIDPGQAPVQIGREKVDRSFLLDLDRTNLQLFMGAADPRSSRVFWAYKSVAGSTGLYDKIIGYDPALDRFFQVSMSGEYLLGISQVGITLEALDSISSSLDALTVSLDAYAPVIQPQISQFNSTHNLGFFTGANLEATIESSEQGTSGSMIYINGFRPITDAATLYGSVSWREAQNATPTQGSEIAMMARTGMCNMRREARYMRFKQRIPKGTTWSFSVGIETDPKLEGKT